MFVKVSKPSINQSILGVKSFSLTYCHLRHHCQRVLNIMLMKYQKNIVKKISTALFLCLDLVSCIFHICIKTGCQQRSHQALVSAAPLQAPPVCFWLVRVSFLWGGVWCQNERKYHALRESRAAGAIALVFMGYYRHKGTFGAGWGKNLMLLSFIFIIHFPSKDYPTIHTKFSKCR